MEQPKKPVKVRCLKCHRRTNHDVVAENTQYEHIAIAEITTWETYQIVRCCGCESMSFRKLEGSSENYDGETGEDILFEQLYPSRTAGRTKIMGSDSFPNRTRQIYSEVIMALNNDAPILAAIGLRAMIESLCLDVGTSSKTLLGRIDELAEMGLLSKYQADFLHKHRFLGNVAAHEIQAPRYGELLAALDIAETVLKAIYILPTIADSIRTGSKSALAQIAAPDNAE